MTAENPTSHGKENMYPHVLLVLSPENIKLGWCSDSLLDYLKQMNYVVHVVTDREKVASQLVDGKYDCMIFCVDHDNDVFYKLFRAMLKKSPRQTAVITANMDVKFFSLLQSLSPLFLLQAPVSRNRLAITLQRSLDKKTARSTPNLTIIQKSGTAKPKKALIANQPEPVEPENYGAVFISDVPAKAAPAASKTQEKKPQPNITAPRMETAPTTVFPANQIPNTFKAIDDQSPLHRLSDRFQQAFSENPFLSEEKADHYLETKDVYHERHGEVWGDQEVASLLTHTIDYYDALRACIIILRDNSSFPRVVLDSTAEVDRYVGVPCEKALPEINKNEIVNSMKQFQHLGSKFFPSFNFVGDALYSIVPFFANQNFAAALFIMVSGQSQTKDKIVHEFYECFDIAGNMKTSIIGKEFLVRTYLKQTGS